jgi:transcriptional regulator
MYLPPQYSNHDREQALALINDHPLATVITNNEGKNYISHIPVIASLMSGEIEFSGHIARANNHYKYLSKGLSTFIFHGPQTYITPKWYDQNNVPTWNYLTIHIEGTAELIEDPQELIQCLKKLSDHMESKWPSGWDFFIPEDLSGQNLRNGIVGFKLKADTLRFKKKLHQSSSPSDRAGVMKGLRTRTDELSQKILKEMEKIYDSEGYTR